MAVCGPALADTTVTAQLQAINHSGVHGTATLTAHDDGSLTVVIHGTGYVPGLPHAQHIHGSFGGAALHVPDDEERQRTATASSPTRRAPVSTARSSWR